MTKITISKRAAVVIAFAVVLAIPGVAGATHIFTDVTDGNVHAEGIEWVANAQVTSGCGDGTTYCPNDPVTRAQMGTFMYRLAGHAPGVPPSVDADTVDGFDAAGLVPYFILDWEPLITDDVAGGTELCITDPVTPAADAVAIFSANASGRADAGSSGIWIRIGVSTDGGGVWNDVSNKISPEDGATVTEDAAVSYHDSMDLTAGTTYNFAVEINGGIFDDVRCQILVSIYPAVGSGVLGQAGRASLGAVDNG